MPCAIRVSEVIQAFCPNQTLVQVDRNADRSEEIIRRSPFGPWGQSFIAYSRKMSGNIINSQTLKYQKEYEIIMAKCADSSVSF
jgi:hypothetical protein